MRCSIFNRAWFGLLLTLFFCLGSGAAVAQTRSIPSNPTFKLQGLDNQVIDLADFRGSVLLVSFGATWCSPCTAELQALQELLAEYHDQPVKFFWVSVETPEQVDNNSLKHYAKERKVTFPVLRDTAQMVYLQFAPRVRLPMIVLIKKDGRIDAPIQFGMQSPATAYKANLRTRLNKLLTDIDSGR
jgi:peroxiredoxin